jgi:tetratricopeptide (TPR) repeat protein
MTEHNLRARCEKARDQLRAGEYDRAIAHCRALLMLHPKYVPAYTIMGEAYLAKGEHAEAANLFRRTLGADPEATIPYAGLGLIYEERGLLEEAIWQLERAFELTPYNKEIRASLLDLYTQRDAAPAPRRKLNRAALARIYGRGHLYEKAITELRDLLRKDPLRVDLRVALAEALWRDERYEGAAVVCQGILDLAPNCLKANLILGEIWLRDKEHEAEGRALLDRAQMLDPENIVAQRLFGDRSPLAPYIVPVPPHLTRDIDEADELDRREELERAEPPEPLTMVEEIAELAEDAEGPLLEVSLPLEDVVTPLEEMARLAEAEPEAPLAETVTPVTSPGSWADASAEVSIQTAEIILPGAPPEAPWRPEVEEETRDFFVSKAQAGIARIESLREQVMSDPDNDAARLKFARAYWQNDQLDRALEEYRPLATRPSDVLAKVMNDLEEITAQDPESTIALELLAQAYAQADRPADALSIYQQLYSRLRDQSIK